jgi:phosphoribosylformylglycinamidine cyclo-ligase
MNPVSRYDARGVSADKNEVHLAVKHLDKGLFPNAFCKILPDIAAGDADFCNIMHADTAGTKTSLAYLYWKETNDLSVWAGIAQDAIVMNVDDMACVGAVDNIILSSTIGRNKHLIPAEVIQAVIAGTTDFINCMADAGIQLQLAGGETADVGDIVRTIDVGITAFARIRRSDVVDVAIQPGDVIVGLASYGQATYEAMYNGGMGSNGLTSARHDLLHHDYYQAYPDSFDAHTDKAFVYTGRHRVTDPSPVDGLDVGKLILSPTRTYLPVIKQVLSSLKQHIHGIIHCSGGAQTKVLKFAPGLKIIKDNLFEVPPLFHLIQHDSGTEWREMYQVFNMGHRLEIYLPEYIAAELIAIAAAFNIDAKIIGRVEAAYKASVQIQAPTGTYIYH